MGSHSASHERSFPTFTLNSVLPEKCDFQNSEFFNTISPMRPINSIEKCRSEANDSIKPTADAEKVGAMAGLTCVKERVRPVLYAFSDLICRSHGKKTKSKRPIWTEGKEWERWELF